ncbi:MAG: hypothetical protein IPP22_14645 [Nitrosomonas sp.]|nr:hypothetical protein [Nitrosomonas sp.]
MKRGAAHSFNLLLRKEYAPSDERMATADYCTVILIASKAPELLRRVGLEDVPMPHCVLQLDVQLTAQGLNRAEAATPLARSLAEWLPGSELSTHRWFVGE